MRNQIGLQALEQFVVLARAKSFTRAAEELHLSQSALSRSIQRLEEQLGQAVCERKPREVVLTETGEALLERAKAILKLTEDMFAELSEKGRRERVRLGAIPTIAPYFLPRVLGGFAKRHADCAVVVEEDTTDVLVRRCLRGEIDLALVALPLALKELEVEPLFTEELYLVVPPGHVLAERGAVSVAAASAHPFVMLNEAHCLSEQIASFCRRQSVQPVAVERTSQLATVQELVSLGHGVSVVPAMARAVDASEQRVYRSFSGERPTRTVAMMHDPGRRPGRAMQALMAHLRAASSAPARRK